MYVSNLIDVHSQVAILILMILDLNAHSQIPDSGLYLRGVEGGCRLI